MSQVLTLINPLPASTWTASYKIGPDVKTLTVDAESTVVVVADELEQSGTWYPLTVQTIATAELVHAPQFPASGSDEIVSVLTVFMGLLSAYVFWTQANPVQS